MSRSRPPDVPADDTTGPALMTPRRLGAKLLDASLTIAEVVARLREALAYVESRQLAEIMADLDAYRADLDKVRAGVVTGRIRLVPGLANAGPRAERPLLDAIEARAADHHVDADKMIDPEPPAAKPKRARAAKPDQRVKEREPAPIVPLEQLLEAESDADAEALDRDWKSTPIEQLELPRVLISVFLGQRKLAAGELADWLEDQLTPTKEARRLKFPEPDREHAIEHVRVALAKLQAKPTEPIRETPYALFRDGKPLDLGGPTVVMATDEADAIAKGAGLYEKGGRRKSVITARRIVDDASTPPPDGPPPAPVESPGEAGDGPPAKREPDARPFPLEEWTVRRKHNPIAVIQADGHDDAWEQASATFGALDITVSWGRPKTGRFAAGKAGAT